MNRETTDVLLTETLAHIQSAGCKAQKFTRPRSRIPEPWTLRAYGDHSMLRRAEGVLEPTSALAGMLGAIDEIRATLSGLLGANDQCEFYEES